MYLSMFAITCYRQLRRVGHVLCVVVTIVLFMMSTSSAKAGHGVTDTLDYVHSPLAIKLGVMHTTSQMRGAQLSLLTNVTRRAMHGVQFSLLGNSTLGEVKGLQSAALFNYAGQARGVQLAALTNIATKGARGLQLSAVSNVAVEASHGMAQLGLSNTIVGALRGAQVGVINYVGGLHGVQLGLLNMAAGERLHGVQIGLINASQDTNALKIGFVNLTPITRTQILLWAGNTTKANVGVRFTNGRLYTQFSLGFVYRGLDDKFSGTLSYRAGYRLPLAPRWAVLGDIGFAHIENANEAVSYKQRRMYALQARVGVSWQCWSRVGLFATSGYSHARYYSRARTFEHKPIVELGFEFR